MILTDLSVKVEAKLLRIIPEVCLKAMEVDWEDLCSINWTTDSMMNLRMRIIKVIYLGKY